MNLCWVVPPGYFLMSSSPAHPLLSSPQVQAVSSHQADDGGCCQQGEDLPAAEPHQEGQGDTLQGGGVWVQQPSPLHCGRGPRGLGVCPWEEAEGDLHDMGLWRPGIFHSIFTFPYCVSNLLPIPQSCMWLLSSSPFQAKISSARILYLHDCDRFPVCRFFQCAWRTAPHLCLLEKQQSSVVDSCQFSAIYIGTLTTQL